MLTAARRRGDRGSVMMLMPAAVLIVLLLGSVAFDFSLVYLRQRQAYNAAAAAANDAVTAGVDVEHLRATGEYVIDPDRADDVVLESLAGSDVVDQIVDVDVDPTGDTVTVALVIRAEYVFAKALPFGPDATTIEVEATAVADVA